MRGYCTSMSPSRHNTYLPFPLCHMYQTPPSTPINRNRSPMMPTVRENGPSDAPLETFRDVSAPDVSLASYCPKERKSKNVLFTPR